MNLLIFDWDFIIRGEISMYEHLKIERNYSSISMLTLKVDGHKENVDKLKEGLLLTTSDNPEQAYIIRYAEHVDEDGSHLEIKAPSINSILGLRTLVSQQTFTGNVEETMRDMVRSNVISPENPRRKIPRIRLGSMVGLTEEVDETAKGGKLDEFLYSVCEKLDVSFDLVMNHANVTFDFVMWKGIDRSRSYSQNQRRPQVIFSKEFENIQRQNYIHSTLDERTTAMVAGEEEWSVTTYGTVNDHLTGLDRKEVYVEASDVKRKYNDEWNRSMYMTPAEYQAAIQNKGIQELAEHKAIETLETDIDMYGQFKYGIDYGLGDVVSIQNYELSLIVQTRVASVLHEVDRKGETLKIEFGSKIPTFVEKIKKAVK